jgi:hypothetical protein
MINGISDGVYTVRKLYPVYLRQGRTGNSPASRVQSPCARSRVPQNAGIEQVNSSQLWMPFHGNLSCGHDKKNWKKYVAIQSFPVSKSRLYHVLPHLLLLSRSGKWRRREEEVRSQPCKSRLGGSYLWDDVGWTSIYFPRSFMKCTSYRREPTLLGIDPWLDGAWWCHMMP